MDNKDKYISPLSTRYASDEMQKLFSERFKFTTWRRLWVALAKAEKALGLDITDEQIAEMEANVENIDFARKSSHQNKRRHGSPLFYCSAQKNRQQNATINSCISACILL